MGSYGKVMVNVQPIRSPDHQIMVNMARLDVLCSISHWELAPAIGGHGRNTTGYCPTSPVEEYQHPATGTKPGDRRRRPDSLGLPVLKFRQKKPNHNKTHPVIGCLHQSSMAMRPHPDLLRCESPHANASVLRRPKAFPPTTESLKTIL